MTHLPPKTLYEWLYIVHYSVIKKQGGLPYHTYRGRSHCPTSGVSLRQWLHTHLDVPLHPLGHTHETLRCRPDIPTWANAPFMAWCQGSMHHPHKEGPSQRPGGPPGAQAPRVVETLFIPKGLFQIDTSLLGGGQHKRKHSQHPKTVRQHPAQFAFCLLNPGSPPCLPHLLYMTVFFLL